MVKVVRVCTRKYYGDKIQDAKYKRAHIVDKWVESPSEVEELQELKY